MVGYFIEKVSMVISCICLDSKRAHSYSSSIRQKIKSPVSHGHRSASKSVR